MPFFLKKRALTNALFFTNSTVFRENLVCEKEGTDQCPLSEKEGIDQFPLFEKEGIQELMFHFSLYYNVNGVSMARRHWKIPSSSLGEKKIWIPHSRLRRSWEIHFFRLGIRREFSNTSSPSLRHSYIVEAAPRDRIWGVGMGKTNEDIKIPANWKGTNILGWALMEARKELQAERLWNLLWKMFNYLKI